MEAIDPFVFRFSIFVLAIFIGYFVVWSVTPALHTPLMSVTNAISSVIIVGALIAVAVSTHPAVKVGVLLTPSYSSDGTRLELPNQKNLQASIDNAIQTQGAAAVQSAWTSKAFGFFALILASVNIFGGFLVTARMLAMYKKKEKPASAGGKAAGH